VFHYVARLAKLAATAINVEDKSNFQQQARQTAFCYGDMTPLIFKVQLTLPAWLEGLENEQVLLRKVKLHDEYMRKSMWPRPRALELLQAYTSLPPEHAEELFDLSAKAPELFPEIVVTVITSVYFQG